MRRAHLSRDRWAQVDTGHLVYLLHDVVLYVHHFKVPPSPAALAAHALGYTVEADELDTVGNFGRHIPEDLLERYEWFLLGVEDVGLVHFICEQQNTFVVAELHDVAHCLDIEASAGGVSRVDNDQCLDGRVGLLGRFDGVKEDLVVHRPVLLLLKVIRQGRRLQVGECSGVEGVLRDRDKTAVALAQRDVHDGADTARRTGSEEDVFGVGRVAITFCHQHRIMKTFRGSPSMNFATRLRIAKTPLEWVYAPTLPIS